MKTLYFGLLLLPLSLLAKNQEDIDLLLKARGLQALERVEALVKKNGNSKGKNLTKKEACEWEYENFYLAFAHPELSKIVKRPVYKQLGEGITAYVFLIRHSDHGIGFQMNYIYKSKNDKTPMLSEITTVKEGYVAKIIHDLPNTISVSTPSCFYTFNLKNPLAISYDAL